MPEEIIAIIDRRQAHGLEFTIAETKYEYGTHYVLFVNGQPGFHSIDLERVQRYMERWI